MSCLSGFVLRRQRSGRDRDPSVFLGSSRLSALVRLIFFHSGAMFLHVGPLVLVLERCSCHAGTPWFVLLIVPFGMLKFASRGDRMNLRARDVPFFCAAVCVFFNSS